MQSDMVIPSCSYSLRTPQKCRITVAEEKRRSIARCRSARTRNGNFRSKIARSCTEVGAKCARINVAISRIDAAGIFFLGICESSRLLLAGVRSAEEIRDLALQTGGINLVLPAFHDLAAGGDQDRVGDRAFPFGID